MALPAMEAFTGGAAVLPNPPWTQANLATPTLNVDGSGNGKASAADATDILAYWNFDSFDDDQYALLILGTGLTSGTNGADLMLRASGSGAGFNAYTMFTDGLSGAGHTEVSKWIGGAQTVLSNFATTFSPGDEFKVVASASEISLYNNGVLVSPFTDSAVVSGSPGCGTYNSSSNVVLIDNWEGGNLAVPQPLFRSRKLATQQRMVA
jgi:hypothetical protein